MLLPFGQELQPWEMDLGSSIPTLPFGPIHTPFLNHSWFCLPGTPAIIPAIVSGVVNRQKCGKPAWLPPSALPPADRHVPTHSFASQSLLPSYPPPSMVHSLSSNTTGIASEDFIYFHSQDRSQLAMVDGPARGLQSWPIVRPSSSTPLFVLRKSS